MTIARIRETMDFYSEYYLPEAANLDEIVVKVYVTKRPGMYGYQFAAVIWYGQHAVASSRTTGCGYDKVNAAAAEAFRELWVANAIPGEIDTGEWRQARMSPWEYCRWHGVVKTLERLFPWAAGKNRVHVAQG